jgi:hypothetical protein
MALKPERQLDVTDIRYTCAAEAEAGDMLVRSTSGSGQLLISGTRPSLTRSANPSGTTPVGAVLHQVGTLDETLYHRNFHKYWQKTNEPCEVVKEGAIVTNRYVGSPTAGAAAYLSSSGCYTPTVHSTGGLVATPLVGEFESAPDEDGYVAIRIQIPRKGNV